MDSTPQVQFYRLAFLEFEHALDFVLDPIALDHVG